MKRDTIRYGNLWVRLVCCLAVGIGVANAVHFGLLNVWEAVGYDLIIEAGTEAYTTVAPFLAVVIVFAICVVSSVFRIERPFAMVVYAVILEGVYLLAVAVAALVLGVALPVVAPFLSLLGCTVFLETMAWSEERSRRRQLERLEAARQQFIDMLVHDLRRRMSSILMSFSLLGKRSDAGDATSRELRNTIRVSAERTLLEINDLLAVRKMEEGKMALRRERIRLGDLLDRSAQELRPAAELMGAGIRVLTGEDIKATVDRNLFGRVVANLLWNALQHTPQGKEVELQCARDGRNTVVLAVTNPGKPIPLDRQGVMFDAFVSGPASEAADSGTGLGLAFCKLAVEAHGGGISVESPCDGGPDGVRIKIKIPVVSAMQP